MELRQDTPVPFTYETDGRQKQSSERTGLLPFIPEGGRLRSVFFGHPARGPLTMIFGPAQVPAGSVPPDVA